MISGELEALGLDASATVIVHASLRSFGWVDGGAVTVCHALVDSCGTVVLPATSWDAFDAARPRAALCP